MTIDALLVVLLETEEGEQVMMALDYGDDTKLVKLTQLTQTIADGTADRYRIVRFTRAEVVHVIEPRPKLEPWPRPK